MVGGGEPGVGGSGFAPTQTGIISMLMKHIESKERGSMQKDQAIFGAMGQLRCRKRSSRSPIRASRSNMLLRERTEYMGMIEDAKSKEHERQIEAHVVTASEERKTAAVKEITRMMPVAISQWLGSGKGKSKNGGAGNSGKPPSPLAIVVSKLIGSLTNDQQVEIEGLLSGQGARDARRGDGHRRQRRLGPPALHRAQPRPRRSWRMGPDAWRFDGVLMRPEQRQAVPRSGHACASEGRARRPHRPPWRSEWRA